MFASSIMSQLIKSYAAQVADSVVRITACFLSGHIAISGYFPFFLYNSEIPDNNGPQCSICVSL